jgi:hypothetical protein
MNLPIQERERAKVQGYLRAQKGNPGFEILLSWFKSELQKRDQENRNTGFENKTSEAKGIADFLDIVTACQAPEADRNQDSKSGAESESAGPLM